MKPTEILHSTITLNRAISSNQSPKSNSKNGPSQYRNMWSTSGTTVKPQPETSSYSKFYKSDRQQNGESNPNFKRNVYVKDDMIEWDTDQAKNSDDYSMVS